MTAIDLAPEEFDASFAELLQRQEVVGAVVTQPYKQRALHHCASRDETAAIAESANLLVRKDDLTWHGAMTDGIGFVAGLRTADFEPKGCIAFMVGAGGAGSGIAAALHAQGIGRIDVFDRHQAKAYDLSRRLGTVALEGAPKRLDVYDLLINASTLGLHEEDPLPFDPASAASHAFVGDVIAEPSWSRLRRAAADKGLHSIGGMEMLAGQIDIIFDNLSAAVRRAQQGPRS
jgi:shikimate dehydrogenase